MKNYLKRLTAIGALGLGLYFSGSGFAETETLVGNSGILRGGVYHPHKTIEIKRDVKQLENTLEEVVRIMKDRTNCIDGFGGGGEGDYFENGTMVVKGYDGKCEIYKIENTELAVDGHFEYVGKKVTSRALSIGGGRHFKNMVYFPPNAIVFDDIDGDGKFDRVELDTKQIKGTARLYQLGQEIYSLIDEGRLR